MDLSHPGTDSHVALLAGTPTVTIISNVLLYREGLAASLARDGRLKVMNLVAGTDALSAIARSRPDIVLLDGAMSDCLEIARRIRGSFERLRIVGFGISGGAARLVDCAESGLTAFVDSDGTVTELVEVVLSALKGELVCSPRVSALMCERLAHLAGGPRRSAILTQREEEIALLIGRGLSNKEIANDLCIGSSTVKNHVHSILEKLNVRRRSAIVPRLNSSPVQGG